MKGDWLVRMMSKIRAQRFILELAAEMAMDSTANWPLVP
jgi:hypothetical protein